MVEGTRSALLRDRRVLVVEDEYFIAAEIAEVLQTAGAVVLGPAASIGAARRIIRGAGSVDAALLDVNLGGDMIWPLLDELRGRRVPLVLASGYDQSAIPIQYQRIPRCEKPADGGSVVRALAAAIELSMTPGGISTTG